MPAIEIQTIENSRLLGWVRIYMDSETERAIRWGSNLIMAVDPTPSIRLVRTHDGEVMGTWVGGNYNGER